VQPVQGVAHGLAVWGDNVEVVDDFLEVLIVRSFHESVHGKMCDGQGIPALAAAMTDSSASS